MFSLAGACASPLSIQGLECGGLLALMICKLSRWHFLVTGIFTLLICVVLA